MRSDPRTRARTVWKNRTISSGVAYPTVSGRFTVVAPASTTASTTATRKFRSLRVASSAENSTSFTWRRARRTAAAAWSRHSARDIRSLCSRWRSEVAMNVWMRGLSAPSRAAAARSMSASTERASAAMTGRRTSRATARTELKSSSEAIGKPASITSTPRASSFRARRTFSASHIEKPGACSPSRSVVSKIVMRAGAAARTWLSVLSMSGHLVHDDRVQERHLRAQLGADLLDEKVLLPFAGRLERRTPVAVFFDPLLGVGPVLDLLEDLLHLAARRLGDDAGAGGVVAVLGRVADGIAHVVEAAAVHEVDDELQLVQALEVRDLGLVARVDERLEARLHERGRAAAEDGLLAEEVRLRLLGERRLEDPGARRTEGAGVCERVLAGVAARVLLDREERGRALAVLEQLAPAVAGRLRRDHRHVHVGGRDDLSEANVEAVREHERLSSLQVRRDRLVVELLLARVGREDHDDVGALRGLVHAQHGQPLPSRLRGRFRRRVQSHHHGNAAVAQVQRVRVPLAAVPDDRDCPPLEAGNVGVLVVPDRGHRSAPVCFSPDFRLFFL